MLTPVNDAAALAQSIRQSLAMKICTKKIIAGGRAAYEKSFTRDAVTKNGWGFNEKLIANHKPSNKK